MGDTTTREVITAKTPPPPPPEAPSPPKPSDPIFSNRHPTPFPNITFLKESF
jgi:hypothetical protein